MQTLERLVQPFAAVIGPLAVCALVFAALAWLTKGRRAFADARAAAGETKINLVMSLVDNLAVTPALTVVVAAMIGGLANGGLHLDTRRLWDWMGGWPTVLAAIVLGDLFGYWRHRAQHTRWLWPAHAVHHSDTRLTWLSLDRMHPVDRAGTALDTLFLAALGLPAWALAANALVRHYYGYFIHADLPWTLGKAGRVINSPVMHRWHHARDVEGSGHNFATVFSVWDQAFGTYHQPGPCTVALGVTEDMGEGALGRYAYPLRAWWRTIRPRQAELSS